MRSPTGRLALCALLLALAAQAAVAKPHPTNKLAPWGKLKAVLEFKGGPVPMNEAQVATVVTALDAATPDHGITWVVKAQVALPAGQLPQAPEAAKPVGRTGGARKLLNAVTTLPDGNDNPAANATVPEGIRAGVLGATKGLMAEYDVMRQDEEAWFPKNEFAPGAKSAFLYIEAAPSVPLYLYPSAARELSTAVENGRLQSNIFSAGLPYSWINLWYVGLPPPVIEAGSAPLVGSNSTMQAAWAAYEQNVQAQEKAKQEAANRPKWVEPAPQEGGPIEPMTITLDPEEVEAALSGAVQPMEITLDGEQPQP